MRPTATLTLLLLSLAAPTVVASALSGEDARAPSGAVHDVLGSAADLPSSDPAAHASGGGQLLGLVRPSPRRFPRIDADSKDAVQKCGTAFVAYLGALWFPPVTAAGALSLIGCAFALPCLSMDCAGDGV